LIINALRITQRLINCFAFLGHFLCSNSEVFFVLGRKDRLGLLQVAL
jgi:hypothetical protein